jgi:hypothetical protein
MAWYLVKPRGNFTFTLPWGLRLVVKRSKRPRTFITEIKNAWRYTTTFHTLPWRGSYLYCLYLGVACTCFDASVFVIFCVLTEASPYGHVHSSHFLHFEKTKQKLFAYSVKHIPVSVLCLRCCAVDCGFATNRWFSSRC